MGCKIGRLLSTYLGMPLGASFNLKTVWNPIIDRISSRLGCWKAKLLSKEGRLTLLKSTLASILNYYLLFFTISESVARIIEARFQNFHWNDEEDCHRYHLVD